MIPISQNEIRSAIGKYAVFHSSKSELAHQLDEMAIPSYLHWNPLVRWIIIERLKVIHKIILKESDIDALLDFGCGIGLLGVMSFSCCERIYSVDLFIEPAKLIKEHFHVPNMVPLEATEFHWDDYRNFFDVIVAADVLEHVDDLEGIFDQIEASLRPNGLLLLSGPTESWFYGLCRKIAGFTGEYHHRNIYDIENLLSKKGWSKIRMRSIPWFLPFRAC